MQTPLNTYRDAVRYIREARAEAERLRLQCDRELALFDSALSDAVRLCKRLEGSEYIGDRICVENRRKDLLRNLKTFTPVQLSEDIHSGVETAENLILGKGSRYSSAEEEKDARLVNLCTYLMVFTYYFTCEGGVHRQEYRAFISSGYEKEQAALVAVASERVSPLLRRTAPCTQIRIEAPSETVSMPEEFPRTACLPLGYYAGGDEGWIRHASECLGEGPHELPFKDLLCRLSRCHRPSNVLMPNLAAAMAGNHMVIHQPRYSIRELDDRPEAADDRPIVEFLETAICRYMNLFPRISKRVALIQPRELSEPESFVSNLAHSSRDLVFSREERDGTFAHLSPADTLRMLLADCRAAKELLSAPWGDIAAYNAANYQKGIWKQMTLLVIKDYPVGFDDRAVEYLESILQEGHKFGITVLMTVCDDCMKALRERESGPSYAGLLTYFDEQNVFTVDGYDLISHAGYERVSFRDTTLRLERFHARTYFSNLERYLANSRDPAIPLSSLFETSAEAERERQQNFSRVLDIPIGKAGTADCHLKLYRAGGGSPHVVIAGTTGSGKSVLLQDIIISAACHYAPEELEMYLFDFKETPKGFERYRHGFPHVKKIATQCRDRDILELLRMIRTVYTTRMSLVSTAGFSDIGAYNRHAAERGLSPIPRMMVVIDEYQTITSEPCLNLLLEIAQKGREYGVVLIMAAQSNKVTHFTHIIRLFGHRFEFKNEPLGELINRIGTRAQELSGPKGLCFYSADGSGGTPTLLRCAYVNDEDRSEVLTDYITHMRRRFGEHPETTYRIGSIRRILRPVGPDGHLLTSAACTALMDKHPDHYTPLLDGEAASEAEWLEAAAAKYESPGNPTDRGFLLRLGLNSINLMDVEYKLDRQNPYLLLGGNGARLKSVEYSVAQSVLRTVERAACTAGVAPAKPCLYYLDGDLQGATDTPVHALRGRSDVHLSVGSREALANAIRAIHDEYEARKACASAREYRPLLVMLSSLDSLMSLFKAPAGGGGGSFLAPSLTARAPGMSPSAAPGADTGREIGEKLMALFSADMYRYDIFICLQLSDPSKLTELKRTLREGSLPSFLFLGKRTDGIGNRAEGEREETLDLLAAFTQAILPNRAAKVSRDEWQTSFAYRLSAGDILEFLPYEYDRIP